MNSDQKKRIIIEALSTVSVKPTDVACPKCGAAAGAHCQTGGYRQYNVHTGRVIEAARPLMPGIEKMRPNR